MRYQKFIFKCFTVSCNSLQESPHTCFPRFPKLLISSAKYGSSKANSCATSKPYFSHSGKFKLIRNVSTKTHSIDETFGIVTKTEIKEFLKLSNVNATEGHACYVIKPCPLCFQKSNQHFGSGILYINKTTGWFSCHQCNHSGEWVDFVQLMQMVKAPKQNEGQLNIPVNEKACQHGELFLQYKKARTFDQLSTNEFDSIVSNLNIKGLTSQSLIQNRVRISEEGTLLFPMHTANKKISAISKLLPESKNEHQHFITEPRQCCDSLFGWQQILATDKEIIITDNPLDMVAIRQEYRKCPCVALPFGTLFLYQHLLPLFEQFSHIILWFNKEASSWETSKMFAHKLCEERCSFVRFEGNQVRPIHALSKDQKISKILQSVEPVKHPSITSFPYLRRDIYEEFSNVETVAGVKWKRFPLLNRLLKGHRRGELTVFTGPTGSGKTTFISEYSLDLCMQGVNTLWGSFEIRNVTLAKTMLRQFSLQPFHENLDQFDKWADRFEQLPLYFMKFHGEENLKKVLEAMSHAMCVYDIQHVVVDNLQFMVGVDDNHFDRFHQQDLILSALRKFATMHNCHVTLVIHPRKEKEGSLSSASIFGGVKASQEADNIMILQSIAFSETSEGKKYIQVTKNRYDGDIGMMPLKFDKSSLTFSSIYKNLDKDSQ